MIVVDASIVVTALAKDGDAGDRARARLRGERLTAPHLLDAEAASAWRRMVTRGTLDAARARRAVDDLVTMPIRRVPLTDLIPRCWQLRQNVTIYDAAYVALAEALGIPLLTADARLVAAPGTTCTFELFEG